MGRIASKVTTGVGETLQFLRNLILNLHDDTLGKIERLSQEITETLQIIRQQRERTTTLLANAGLALAAAFGSALLLYLTNSSAIQFFVFSFGLCMHYFVFIFRSLIFNILDQKLRS